jgi:DNA-binding MarR family transcriptional regulator
MGKSNDGPVQDGGREGGIGEPTLRGMVGYNMRRAYLRIQEDFAASLAGLELRAVSFSTLSLIVDNPDIIQSRLAAALKMERSNLVLVVDELEERELVTRNRLKSDRRAYALRATLKGRRLRDRAVKIIEEHEERVLARLTPDERRELVRLLNLVEAS